MCIKSHEQIQSYKKRLKLCFGQDSEFVEEWIHKLTMNKEHANYEQIMNEYSERLCLTNENIIRFKREADCLFK